MKANLKVVGIKIYFVSLNQYFLREKKKNKKKYRWEVLEVIAYNY